MPPHVADPVTDPVTELLDLDARHVWHPYAPMPARTPSYPVVAASGVRLQLADGREVVDGMSSWWAAIHGYRNPVLDAAVVDQLARMAHVMFGGLTHEPAVRLARQLVDLSPAGLDHVFFCDSGSVAVEVGVKMALQYWHGRGRPDKSRLLALRGGYHGDTFMAMSICDPVGGMHHLFGDAVAHQVFADRPPSGDGVDAEWLHETEGLLVRNQNELAAVVIEPVVQGAGGMYFYDAGYVTALRRLCDKYGVLLVLDEIATGFGRTGAMFAAEHAAVAPDIMCVGKALTGGYMTLAATLCTSEVAESVSNGLGGALMHGPTFMANPLACAVASASLGLLEQRDWRTEVAAIASGLRSGLSPLSTRAGVTDVRVLGAIGVVQLDRPVDVSRATEAALAAGVWLRPFRDLIYTMPPYVSSSDDVEQICGGVTAAVEACT